MTDMHRAPGLQFPKGTPSKVDRKTRGQAVIARDRRESLKVKSRSLGRCEVIIDSLVCRRRARHVHHMIKGHGQRGHGISARAEHKQHACRECHDLIERHDVERAKATVPYYTVPYYTDTYRTKKR